MKKIILLLSLIFFSDIALADDLAKCPECPECPSCEEEKDLSDWQVSTSLGFNLTRGNSDTLLLNSKTKADREINEHIYHLSVDGSLGEDKNLDDEVNGTTSQKQAKVDASYKHLLSERIYALGGGSAFFDQIADVDYRYIFNVGLGYFLLKNDVVKLSVEAGPSYVFEKQGGAKNDYPSSRIAERFDWQISETAKVFQTVEVLMNLKDGDDTLVTAEAGLEAAINSTLALVVSVKDIYDNLPSESRERNDLTVITGLQVTY